MWGIGVCRTDHYTTNNNNTKACECTTTTTFNIDFQNTHAHVTNASNLIHRTALVLYLPLPSQTLPRSHISRRFCLT
jgi:hypothetical protein